MKRKVVKDKMQRDCDIHLLCDSPQERGHLKSKQDPRGGPQLADAHGPRPFVVQFGGKRFA